MGVSAKGGSKTCLPAKAGNKRISTSISHTPRRHFKKIITLILVIHLIPTIYKQLENRLNYLNGIL